MRPLALKVIYSLLFSLAFAAPARALEPIDPANSTLTIDDKDQLHILVKNADGTTKEKIEPLIKVKKGDKFFHWTLPENVERWGRQGHIDHGEIEYLSKPTGDRQVYGAGYYTSADPLDSSGFGARGVMIEAPEDFFITQSAMRGAEPAAVKPTYDALRRKGILGAQANANWRVFWDERTVRNVRPLSGDDVLDFYHRTGNDFGLTSLETFANRFGLKPHPALDQALPGYNRLLTRQPVTEEELKNIVAVIYAPNRNYPNLKKSLAGKISPATIQEHLLPYLASRGQMDPSEYLLYVDQQVGGLKSGPSLRKVYPIGADFLEGKPLSTEDRQALKKILIGDDLRSSYGGVEVLELKTETPLIRAGTPRTLSGPPRAQRRQRRGRMGAPGPGVWRAAFGARARAKGSRG
jgi:hypothetical protein